MAEKNGWIKFYRKTLDNPIVMKDADHLAIWAYLILSATHDEYPALFKGEKIMLQPGQLLTGRIVISKLLSINESKVRRVLNNFENDQQIDRQISNKNTLITIHNWSEYQNSDQQTDQQVTNNRPTSDQQVTTNKNVRIKECKNVRNKKDNSASDNALSKSDISSFFESVWLLYPNKKGKGQVSDSKKKELYKIGFDELKRAIDRYKKDLEADADWRKPQNGSTFFNSGYVDYLDANYTPPERRNRTVKKNSFNGFSQQREYDFSKLEEELFANNSTLPNKAEDDP